MVNTIIGLLLVFISMAIQVIIPPIPAEVIVIGSSKLYGILITTIVAGAGLYLGSVLTYLIGRYIQKRFEKFFSKEKVEMLIQKLRKFEDLILWIRFLPYNPADTIAYAAGIMKIDFKKFVIIAAFTSFIRCFLLAYMGDYITNLKTIIIAIVLILLTGLIAYLIIFGKDLIKYIRAK